jgi:hypothetical protein
MVMLVIMLALPIGPAHVMPVHDHWLNGLIDPVTHAWCCDARDCLPEIVREVPGGYLVETGETIPSSRIIWKSQDGRWWRCAVGQDRQQTRCLIGPPPSM